MSKFLDNLIPLRARLNGEQYAGWRPSRFAHENLGCHLIADEKIPVSKGVSLSADVYIPKKPGRYPAIVQMGAYNKELHSAGAPTGNNEVGSPPVFTNHGYAQVILSRRGMGRSEGTSGMFWEEQELEDYERAISWAASQPWCTGEVVMFGYSYYAVIQLLIAARRPKALKAFFAMEICTDYYRHLTNYGGTVNPGFFGLWLGANFKDKDLKRKVSPWKRALIGQFINREIFWRKIAHPKMCKMYSSFVDMEPSKQALEQYRELVLHRKRREDSSFNPGPYKNLDQITVPFVIIQNPSMWNIHQFGAFDLMDNAGTPENHRWLILSKAEYELPVASWQLEAIAFFDAMVKGIDNGYKSQAQFRYFVEGEEKYRNAEKFPVPQSKRIRNYLTQGGTLEKNIPENSEAHWTAIPAGTRTLKGFEKVVDQVLSYKMTVDHTIAIAGPLTVGLKFSCNEIDSYIIARLSRVDAAGKSHLLSMGAVSPARSTEVVNLSTSGEIVNDAEIPIPLVPGIPVIFRFSLTPSATRLESGDFLVLDIASRSDLLMSTPYEGFAHFDLAVPPYFSKNTLHFGPATYLEFDIV